MGASTRPATSGVVDFLRLSWFFDRTRRRVPHPTPYPAAFKRPRHTFVTSPARRSRSRPPSGLRAHASRVQPDLRRRLAALPRDLVVLAQHPAAAAEVDRGHEGMAKEADDLAVHVDHV